LTQPLLRQSRATYPPSRVTRIVKIVLEAPLQMDRSQRRPASDEETKPQTRDGKFGIKQIARKPETKIRRVDVDGRAELLIIPASDAPLAGEPGSPRGLLAGSRHEKRFTSRLYEASAAASLSLWHLAIFTSPLYLPSSQGAASRFYPSAGNEEADRRVSPRVWHEGVRGLSAWTRMRG